VGANDLVLKASEQMHGLPRSGRSILGLPSVDTIETSDSEFGSLLADIHALLKQRLPPEKRFGLLQTRSEQGIYWVIRARPPFA
jgi:hypothetical protein